MARVSTPRSLPESAGNSKAASLFAAPSPRMSGLFRSGESSSPLNAPARSVGPDSPTTQLPRTRNTGGSNESPVSRLSTTTQASTATAPSAAAPTAEEKERELRQRAINQLTRTLRHQPNGKTRRPPVWYRRPDDLPSTVSESHRQYPIYSRRPRLWIKDWDTGIIRPRRMLNNLKQAKMEKERAAQRKRKAEDPPSPSAATPKAKKVCRARAGAGGSKRKAIDPDESEAEQEQQSPAELESRVREIAKKRRRLAQNFMPLPRYETSGYCTDDDDSD